ncbi:hypothetical protein BU17DRAFT_93101 [Hysterangium stoloniferum]|nr:hypothetical protein BU17DRAFT_93101 [Hysterangium stoloniferum]
MSALCSQHTAPLTFEALCRPTPPSAPSCTPASPGTAMLIQHSQHPTGSPAHPSPSSHASWVCDMAAPVGCLSGGCASAIDGCTHWHDAEMSFEIGPDSSVDVVDGGGGGVMHMEVDVGGHGGKSGSEWRLESQVLFAIDLSQFQIQDVWAVLSSLMRATTQNQVQKVLLFVATSSPKPGCLHLQPNLPGSPSMLNISNLTSSHSPEVMFAGTGSGCGADDAMANAGQGSDISISQGDPSSDSG